MPESVRAGLPVANKAKLSSGLEIHYHDVGAGPAVLYIHGSGPGASGYANFKGNYPDVVEAGHRAIVPDLIGYGLSSKPEGVDYSVDMFASTLYELLDQLGVDKCILIGNSLGGAVAIAMALLHPERVPRLVLMAPGGVEPRETYSAMLGIAAMFGGFLGPGFDEPGFRKLMGMLTSDPRHVTDELIAERYPVYKTQPKDVLGRLISPDQSARLAELTMPVQVFWGVKDQFCPVGSAEKFKACPDVRIILFGNCGHWVMVEHRDEFNAYVRHFISH